jgi:hypothetical protein
MTDPIKVIASNHRTVCFDLISDIAKLTIIEQAKANARHPHQSSWAHLGGLRHVYYPDSKTNRWFDETGPITKTAARLWLRRKLHSAEGQSS